MEDPKHRRGTQNRNGTEELDQCHVVIVKAKHCLDVEFPQDSLYLISRHHFERFEF